jgi:hypothetical protein
MGHQKAAFEILTQLFTPQSIMQTPLGRMVLTWYARFDVFIGIMGSVQCTLPRDWYAASASFSQAQVAAEPGNVNWKIDYAAAQLRLISVEMSYLFGKGTRGEIGRDEYLREHFRISRALYEWKERLDPCLVDSAYLVRDLPVDRLGDVNNIVDPYTPGVLFAPPIFASTILTCEWHSITLMHSSQTLEDAAPQPQPDLVGHALAICQITETVGLWPRSPEGSLIILQACLAMAALFVPRDARHHMWIRRKFALLELKG